MIYRWLQLILLGLSLGSASAEFQRIEVFPNAIVLGSQRSQTQIVVTGWRASGEPRDLTREATITVHDPAIATFSNGRIAPRADGKTVLTVAFKNHRAEVPVAVTHQKQPDPVRFHTEVQAALTKQGCNAGSCHGSPQGKAGFSLSLFGFDSKHDQQTLVREGHNRRLNTLVPEESLMLKKPLLRIPHVGGKRLKPSDTAYAILYQWIYEGAQAPSSDPIQCVRLEVYPGPDRILRAPHLKQQLSVQAFFSDGSHRDVTHLATYETSNRPVATVEPNGLVTGSERGLAAITIRYLQHLESVYFTVVRDVPGFVWEPPPETNYVDTLVNRRLKLLQIPPAETCSDTVFLRRISLDLTGLLPSAERARSFLQSPDRQKRAKLIDELLESHEFARFQSLQMADLFRINPKTLTDGRAELFSNWITETVKQNEPFDRVTQALLNASGDSKEIPPANYYASLDSTEQTIETTAQIFMGSRVQCAKCHNHPFENWTQDDYYQIGAVFNRIQRSEGIVKMANSGEMTHPRTGKIMQPWGGGKDSDRLTEFSRWLTAPENPYFARVIVNRIWAHFLGRGIVEPIDDFRSSNPPTNVPLLDALADDLVAHGFDRRHIIRMICNSQVYQRSTKTTSLNAEDHDNFSHFKVRLLTAEQLNDAIAYLTKSAPTSAEIAETTTQLEQQQSDIVHRLDTERHEWKDREHAKLMALDFWEGSHRVSPFYPTETADQAVQRNFLGTDRVTQRDAPNEWQQRQAWKNGQDIRFSEREPGARYLFQTLWVRESNEAKIEFHSNAGLVALCNSQPFLEQDSVPSKHIRQRASLPLRAGINHLVIKIAQGKQAVRFTARILELGGNPLKEIAVSDRPSHINDLLFKPSKEHTPTEQAQLRTFHQSTHRELVNIRKQLREHPLLLATQRPWPEQTAFLKAFGQPERTSPCTCERTGDPTLEQALQLLNGQEVVDQIQGSHRAYEGLDDNELIETLYLTALSRPPSTVERDRSLHHLNTASPRSDAIQDLIWALINTQEFMFQH